MMLDLLEMIMEVRDVSEERREMVGIVAPYDEVSYLTPDPAGERYLRGAFAKSIRQKGGKIPLLRNHDQSRKLGTSKRFIEDAVGLVGEFSIVPGDHGDAMLDDLRNGCLDQLSMGFKPLTVGRGADGVREVKEGMLVEVSAVAIPAYAGAAVTAVRNAQNLDELLAPFQNRPAVNLDPVPQLLYRSRR